MKNLINALKNEYTTGKLIIPTNPNNESKVDGLIFEITHTAIVDPLRKIGRDTNRQLEDISIAELPKDSFKNVKNELEALIKLVTM